MALVVAALSVLVFLVWRYTRGAADEPVSSRAATPTEATPSRNSASTRERDPSPVTPDPPRDLAAAPSASVSGGEEELRLPHSITTAHQRIFRENNLIGSMNGAMDVGDYAALRRLNAEYRADYPEDANVLQEGYDLIADCLEASGTEQRARAERYWRTHKASQLRRYVRRHCLQGKTPS